MRTGTVPTRGVRHPMTVVTKARHLADGGWQPAEIRRLLAADGTHVSLATVSRWIDAEAHRRWKERGERAAARRAAARGAAGGAPRVTARVEFRFARLQLLRAAGLSHRDTAAVLQLDFGEPITGNQVRYAERVGRYPRTGPGKGSARVGGRPRKVATA